MTKARYFLIAALTAAPFLIPSQAEANDRYCREYTKTVHIGGDIQSAYGTACMQPDGSWEMVSFNGHENLFDDIAYDSRYGNGRIVRVEQRPVTYYYPVYQQPRYYTHYRRPVNVFSFTWGDNDRRHDNDRRDWRRDRHDHDHDRGNNGRGHNRH